MGPTRWQWHASVLAGVTGEGRPALVGTRVVLVTAGGAGHRGDGAGIGRHVGNRLATSVDGQIGGTRLVAEGCREVLRFLRVHASWAILTLTLCDGESVKDRHSFVGRPFNERVVAVSWWRQTDIAMQMRKTVVEVLENILSTKNSE